MSTGSENRELLLCSIALKENLVASEELEEALRRWMQDPSQALAEVLLDCGYISSRGYERLTSLVDQRVSETDGQKSPSAIFETLPSGVRAALGDGPPTVAVSSQPVESVVPRFLDLQLYAEGGLGEVFLAQDSQVPRTVAVKQIKKRWADDLDSRTRFLQEAQITGRLEHPGVVPVYALGADDTGRPYYAMRFIQGESLLQVIDRFHGKSKANQRRRERLLELRKLLARFLDVCNAMDYAHSRGIIHRDVKPSNIMLGAYGETFVVDWGLAKVLGAEEEGDLQTIDPWATQFGSGSTDTRMGTAMGTPAYMSPEQAAGKLDELGPATDIYSMGVTLYQLLTGNVPHADQSVESVFERISRGEFAPPRELADWVPRALESICLKALAQRPEDRYRSAREMADDLERWLADERVTAHEEGWLESSFRWMRQHRTLVASAVVAQMVLGAALTAGLYAWSKYEEQQYQHDLEMRQREQQRLSDLQAATDAAEQSAQTEMAAGRFTAAQSFLASAVDAIQDEPLMTDQHEQLQQRLERVARIVDYYGLSELGEEKNFNQRDTEAQALISGALRKLGVLQHGDWWAHLPAEDLSAEQLDHLRRDVYHKLNLLLATYSKDAYLYVASRKGRSNARLVLDLNDLIQWYRPCEFARWHASYSRFRLGRGSPLEFSELGLPKNSSDAYTMSSMYAIAAQNEQVRSMIQRGDEQMLVKARELLELATEMSPDHYWSHYLLAATCMVRTRQDVSLDEQQLLEHYQEARQVLGHCIALRPDFWLSYAERSLTYQGEIKLLRDRGRELTDEEQEELEAKIRLMTDDCQCARDRATNTWQIHWYLGTTLYTTGQIEEAVDAFQRAIEMGRTFEVDVDTQFVDTQQMIALPEGKQVANELLTDHPDNPRYLVLLAAAELGSNDFDAAFAAADRAIGLPEAPPTAWSIRGTVLLQRQEYESAESDFRLALARRPGDTLAALGLARVLQEMRDYQGASSAYEKAAELAETPDGQAAGYLGACRMLLMLQRYDEALAMLVEARRVKPSCEIVTVINLAKQRAAEPFIESLTDWLRTQEKHSTAGEVSRVVRELPLLNGDFELGLSRYWTNAAEGGPVWNNVGGCRSQAEIDSTAKHDGNFSLHINNLTSSMGGAYGTTSQTLPADRRQRYRITLWAKAKNLSSGGLRIVVDDAWNRPILELPVGTYDWTEFSGEFELAALSSSRRHTAVPTKIRLVTTAPGEAWVDDLQLRLVEEPKAEK